MTRIMRLSDDEILAAAVALDFWTENVRQEDTNQVEFNHVSEVLNRLKGLIR